jgi:hypothetical protein
MVVGDTAIVGHVGVIVKARGQVQLLASVVVIVKLATEVLLGMPEIAPVEVFNVAHVGNAPLVTANV